MIIIMSALMKNLEAMSIKLKSKGSNDPDLTFSSSTMDRISSDSSPPPESSSPLTNELKILDLNPGISPPSPPSSPPPPIPKDDGAPETSLEDEKEESDNSAVATGVTSTLTPKADDIKIYCDKANHEPHIVYDYEAENASFMELKESNKPASSSGDTSQTLNPELDEKILLKIIGKWNYSHKPSKTKRSEGVGWIIMKSPKNLDINTDGSDDSNDEEIKTFWNNYIGEHGKTKSAVEYFDLLKEMAIDFKVYSGKWLFHTHPDYVDIVWYKIVKALRLNKFPDFVTHAKVSPVDDLETSIGTGSVFGKPGRGPTHVICIYNKNFTDESQIKATHNVMREIGIYHRMMYKPDIFSILGIYRNNDLGLRPTIYMSTWDYTTKKSKIENVIATFMKKKNDKTEIIEEKKTLSVTDEENQEKVDENNNDTNDDDSVNKRD